MPLHLHSQLLVLALDIMDTALETVFSTALCNTKLIVQDALSGLTMERDVALMRVRLLEAEKVKVEESITRLEGELVEASFNSAAEKDTKEKLQQRVRAVERVNALLTDRMNEACFDLNKKKTTRTTTVAASYLSRAEPPGC